MTPAEPARAGRRPSLVQRPTSVLPGWLAVALVLLGACGSPDEPADGDDDASPVSAVVGRVALGPQCPVEVEGQPCPDQPAGGAQVTVAGPSSTDPLSLGATVATGTTEDDGRFRIEVPPGSYVVTAAAGMSCDVVAAEVGEGAEVTVDLTCDTGIR